MESEWHMVPWGTTPTMQDLEEIGLTPWKEDKPEKQPVTTVALWDAEPTEKELGTMEGLGTELYLIRRKLDLGEFVIKHKYPVLSRRVIKLLRYVVNNKTIRCRKLSRILRHPMVEVPKDQKKLEVNGDWDVIQRQMYYALKPQEYEAAKNILRYVSVTFYCEMVRDTDDEEATWDKQYPLELAPYEFAEAPETMKSEKRIWKLY